MAEKEVKYILGELVGYGCNRKKNTTHLNPSLCHILLEKGNLRAIWPAFQSSNWV